jgi:hypothetical protein
MPIHQVVCNDRDALVGRLPLAFVLIAWATAQRPRAAETARHAPPQDAVAFIIAPIALLAQIVCVLGGEHGAGRRQASGKNRPIAFGAANTKAESAFCNAAAACMNRRSGLFATRRFTRTAAPHHEADLDVACADSSAVHGDTA